MSGDDSDGEGEDSDGSDSSSGDEAVFFDEQFPGEAAEPDAQVDPFETCCSPADLAAVLANDALLALHPAVAELVTFFTENDVDGDEPFMAAIADIRAKAAAGALNAHRIAALCSRLLALSQRPHRRSGRWRRVL